jgi:hypothetical protein
VPFGSRQVLDDMEELARVVLMNEKKIQVGTPSPLRARWPTMMRTERTVYRVWLWLSMMTILHGTHRNQHLHVGTIQQDGHSNGMAECRSD